MTISAGEITGPPPVEASSSSAPAAGPSSPLQLIWRALWFNEAAFAEVRDSANPLMRGFVVLLIVSVVAGVAGAIGVGFDRLTSPDMQSVQQIALDGIQDMAWYRDMAEGPGGAEFEQQFLENYNRWWSFAPQLFGAPTLSGALSTLCIAPLAGILGWLLIGSLIHLAARALGGRGTFGQTLGVLALASAPQILTVATLIPRLEVGGLAGWWSLALGYWAVRSVHRLTWQRNVLAVLLPRVAIIVLLIILGAILLGLLSLAAPAAGQ